MFEFDAAKDRGRPSERFEAGHRPHDAFDRAVILLDNVAEIVDLPNRDRYGAFRVRLPQHWRKPDCPPIDQGMVNHHAAFLHHFFKVAIPQEVSRLPANANQNHIHWKLHSFSIQHGRLRIFERQWFIGQQRSPH